MSSRLGLACWVTLLLLSCPALLGEKQLGSGRFALMIDGQQVGFAMSAEGGVIRAQVADELDPAGIVRKHVATIAHEDLTLELYPALGQPVIDWINESWTNNQPRTTGTLVSVDFDYGELNTRMFFEALIAEVTFPALDIHFSEDVLIMVRAQPMEIDYLGGRVGSAREPKGDPWQTNNFRFELGSLPCDRVVKIDAFSIKQTVAEGGAAAVEVPNIKITFSAADLQALEAWSEFFKDFVINGNASAEDELDGAITFLSPDLKTELGSIDLMGVGIISLTIGKAEANSQTHAKFQVELYVEEMQLNIQN